MKLDIGAAECPMCLDDNPEEWVTLDTEGKCGVCDYCKNYPSKCRGNVSVIAVAEHLPFRDSVLELARSSSCVLLLTENIALDEMLRVSNEIHVRDFSEGIHYLINKHCDLIEEWSITEIFEMGSEVQLWDVKMKKNKVREC